MKPNLIDLYQEISGDIITDVDTHTHTHTHKCMYIQRGSELTLNGL